MVKKCMVKIEALAMMLSLFTLLPEIEPCGIREMLACHIDDQSSIGKGVDTMGASSCAIGRPSGCKSRPSA